MAFDKKIHIKHIEIWIILLVLMIGTAVFFITWALTHIGESDYQPGYYEITGLIKEDAPHYNDDYTLLYYLDGEGTTSIQYQMNDVQEMYSNTLYTYYISLDEENEYENVLSLGYVNHHINEEITLDNRTYNILVDAYNRSKNSDNYSIFAAPLYGYWDDVLSVDYEQQISLDPLNNSGTLDALTSVSEAIKDSSNIDFELLGNNKIILKVSESYKNLLIEKEMDSYPYISLNALKTSYIVESTLNTLNEKNYKKGILLSHDGALKESVSGLEGTYPLYEKSENSLLKVATLRMNAPLSLSSYHRYDISNQANAPYYQIEKNSVTYYRSSQIDINLGYSNNAYNASIVASNDTNIVETTYINNELASKTNIEEIKVYLSSHNLNNEMVLIDFHKNDKNIYASKSIYNFVSISEELDYNLINFQEVNA